MDHRVHVLTPVLGLLILLPAYHSANSQTHPQFYPGKHMSIILYKKLRFIPEVNKIITSIYTCNHGGLNLVVISRTQEWEM